ncbi:hypothetical protein PTTG_08222 [Puccinia triticina 1-1 BBBD Race 1]|uniref:COP9 signalosome complex subunit 6 n=2 Tax=Puccinia triticina TaxID=208348 RepID=A0A180GFQ5_PUCT1|nr:uncharacterized protein PtA15_1A185 [Puccinia triticina]OAV91557.1 hypothetical protein PTTG_08222 [Puccinia triticina 1-1 BBBD Race 1]WAQ80847.1 hypothetical protein PtA15_1A185 [Puccinia triticina]WAR51739.1 hypothetical protein PtB15_1B175 [Puccinia triticina]
MANQSQATQSSRIICQSANVSDLDISLHPLPILNISDHFTRTRLQAERPDIDIFGALIGTQIGKKIEIVNCFEILTDPDGKVNDGFLKTRREQFQQVFPTLDLLGWYTNGFQPRERDLTILNQVAECADLSSPILLFYDPLPTLSTGSTTAKELPIQIYEFTQSTAGTDGEAFVKGTFDVQTSEAERIAVDSVAKPDVGSKDSGLVASLITQRNAIQMLHNKLGTIVDYIAQLMGDLEAGNSATKIDHGLLREISSLVASLPKPEENASFKKEFMIESNDALLTSYLSSQSKVLTETNQLIDRYLYLNTREINHPKSGPHSILTHTLSKSMKVQK